MACHSEISALANQIRRFRLVQSPLAVRYHNQAKKNGESPLYIACQYGQLEVVNALSSRDGIDVNQAETKYGYTPLCIACEKL